MTAEECESAYGRALALHPALAPRFENEFQCSSRLGTCVPIQERGRTYWIPPQAGYLVGYDRREEEGAEGYTYFYRGSLPLYRDYYDGRYSYFNPQGGQVGREPGPVYGRAGNIAPPASPLTISRGGFGATTSRFARSNFGS